MLRSVEHMTIDEPLN